MSQQDPLALYVHLPWCIKKCPYCDFNSHAITRNALSAELEARYLGALLADFERDYLALAGGRPLSSLFFGGGTPSLLSAGFYQQFFAALRGLAQFAADVEISLEANPGAVDTRRFAGYLEAGINRLSIGVQSFSAVHLERLGRVHSAEDAARAFQLARDAGFDNINLDLMYGLPGQTMDQALADLQRAIDFEPQHLSWYQLTIEPNTAFYSAPPTLPDEELLYAMSEAGQSLLADAGYQQYEVSAYARAGYRCRHNDNYWQFGDYLGVGAGAHGKLRETSGKTMRYWKYRQPDAYMDAIAKTAGSEFIEGDQLVLEFVMNTLRRRTGFSIGEFERSTGQDFGQLATTVDALIAQQLLEKNGERIQTSALGARFLNDVVARFLA